MKINKSPVVSLKGIGRKTDFEFKTKQNLTEFLDDLKQINKQHKHDLVVRIYEDNARLNSPRFSIDAGNFRILVRLEGQFESLDDETNIVRGFVNLEIIHTIVLISLSIVTFIIALGYALNDFGGFAFVIITMVLLMSFVVVKSFNYGEHLVEFLLETLSSALQK